MNSGHIPGFDDWLTNQDRQQGQPTEDEQLAWRETLQVPQIGTGVAVARDDRLQALQDALSETTLEELADAIKHEYTIEDIRQLGWLVFGIEQEAEG